VVEEYGACSQALQVGIDHGSWNQNQQYPNQPRAGSQGQEEGQKDSNVSCGFGRQQD